MHIAQLMTKHTAQLPVMQHAYPCGMAISSLRHLRRRSNLEALVKEFGGASALALHIGTPKTHISALLAGSRGIGDQLAAKLERKCEKPAGWMDEQHEEEVLKHPRGAFIIAGPDDSAVGVSPSKEDIQLLADLYELLPEDRERFVSEIRARAEQMRKHADVILRRAGVKSIPVEVEQRAAEEGGLKGGIEHLAGGRERKSRKQR